MRASIVLTFIILAIGATLRWQDHQRLEVIRTEHDKLVAMAAGAGITLGEGDSGHGIRVTKREREDREAIARLAASDLIAFAREMEAMEESGKGKDENMQKRILEMMDRMMALDSSQLKILIAEVRANRDLKDDMRRGIIGFSIMTLANDHPQAALTLFTEASEDFKDDGMGKHVISTSLAKWAKDDPMAALAWVRENGKRFPDLVNDDAKKGMISGAAASDPGLAFSLIGELGFKDASGAIDKIVGAARTPDERTATLAALRDHLAASTDPESIPDISGGAIRELTRSAAEDGFEAGSKWIEEAGFSNDELSQIGGFSHTIKSDETGKWVEWMGKNLPAGKSDDSIRDMVSNWTRNDYQAAGKWLATTPEGAARNASVRAYAETVAKYDPETAAQWAMTLPAGADRELTIKSIYQDWPRKDDASKAARDAFGKAHGIK